MSLPLVPGGPQATKQSLMTSLILAFGVMILRDGLFHTDPHPGNVMALVGPEGQVQVALVDFGQVRQRGRGAACVRDHHLIPA